MAVWGCVLEQQTVVRLLFFVKLVHGLLAGVVPSRTEYRVSFGSFLCCRYTFYWWGMNYTTRTLFTVRLHSALLLANHRCGMENGNTQHQGHMKGKCKHTTHTHTDRHIGLHSFLPTTTLITTHSQPPHATLILAPLIIVGFCNEVGRVKNKTKKYIKYHPRTGYTHRKIHTLKHIHTRENTHAPCTGCARTGKTHTSNTVSDAFDTYYTALTTRSLCLLRVCRYELKVRCSTNHAKTTFMEAMRSNLYLIYAWL